MPRTKNLQKQQAKYLYFTTDKTQKAIAAMLGLTEQSICKWAKNEHWAAIKQATYYSSAQELNQLYEELREMNGTINSRDEGQRFSTKEELDAKTKILKLIAGPLKDTAGAWRNVAPQFDFEKYQKEEEIPQHTTVLNKDGKEIGRVSVGDIKMRQRMPNGLYAYDIRDMHDYYMKVANMVIAADMASWPKDAGKDFVPTGLQTLLDGIARKEKEEAKKRNGG